MRNCTGDRLSIDELRMAAAAIGSQGPMLSLQTHGDDVSIPVPVLNGRILGDVDRSHRDDQLISGRRQCQ